MNKHFTVAIDGPSGAGKSTIAKMCAKRFGFVYVDTGAIYRSVGLAVKRAGVGSKDAEGVEKVLSKVELDIRYSPDGLQHMYLSGEDVTEEIREPEISIYASDISAMPPVRAFLLEMQRSMARSHSVIMDGRDIGTVVLKDADLKIFLTAEDYERAQRRYDELMVRGIMTTYDEVLKDIKYRDQNDSTRETAPLRPAEDAVILDTTGNSLDESFEMISKIIQEHME